MNPLDWARTVDVLGYPLACLLILVESAGVPIPGELLLLAAGAWAATRQHSIALVILTGFLGAAAGADAGYVLGYRGGRPFVEQFGNRFRIWSSMLAGMARMPFWRFQLFSAIGALGWAVAIGAAGYFLGSNLDLLESIARSIGAGGLVILTLIALVLFAARERAARPR